MNLKRTYTISIEPEVAESIEAFKKKSGLSYTEIFLKGIEKLELPK